MGGDSTDGDMGGRERVKGNKRKVTEAIYMGYAMSE
jgi:hypothetical protein